MKQSEVLRVNDLLRKRGIMRIFSFKAINTRAKCALLAKANLIMAGLSAITRERSAHFQSDCFECLSPHNIAA